MREQIDVRLESLAGSARPEEFPREGASPTGQTSNRASDSASVSAGKTFYLETFGCQMNAHDSEKVAGVLLQRGYSQVETIAAASMVLYNTCSIREKAAHKVFSRLGEFRDADDGKIIGVLGCVAQQEGEKIFKRAPWVSLVCGSASYSKLHGMIQELETGNRRVTGLDNDTDETFETEMTRRDHPFRAYITIIEGCDKACTYCVVPFTRGPERSRASANILEEARRLADAGYTEIQLLGQTVNSYRDPSPRRMSFSEILLAVANVEGIRRVRFTTSHPNDFGADIIAAMDSHPGICEHVHLPVQSGSTRVLRAMERTYSREQYLEKLALIRNARRDVSITTDVIVGFPGETDAEFDETLSLLDEAQYDMVFSFKYSPRPNTAAESMPGAISESEQAAKLQVLMEKQRVIQHARNQRLIGKNFEVLVDGNPRRENQWAGRTSSNLVVNFTSPSPNLLGQYIDVQISSASPNSLVGAHVI
jgi:tRNA-2-methylthio-N6-dimethylallyladenosine synthase